MRIQYFPSGFTVGKVFSGDLSEVLDGDVAVSPFEGSRPDKLALHIEVSDSFAFLHP